MPEATAHILAVAHADATLRVQVDRQGTTVESADATLSRYRAEDGDLHLLLRRSDGRIVTDYALSPYETVRYALLKPGRPLAALHWQTISASETPVPPSPSRLVRWLWGDGAMFLRTGLLWNLLVGLPTLYYFCLPYGSVADADDFCVFWVLPASAAVFLIGIPLYVRAIVRRRAQKRPFGPEASALLFCLTPVFLALALLYLAGVVRGLKTGFVGDGGAEITWQQGR